MSLIISLSHLLSRKSFLKSSLKPSCHGMSQCTTSVAVRRPNWMRLHWVARGVTFLEGDEARREVAQARGTGPRAPPSNCHGSDGDGGACQRTPPHDLIAAFARRWLREQALAARVGHRAQGQEGGKASRDNNRAVSMGLRREVPPASRCHLWLVTPHLGSSSQAPRLPTHPQRTTEKGRRDSLFLPKGQSLHLHLFRPLSAPNRWP